MARIGDYSQHGGVINVGYATVLVGDAPGGGTPMSRALVAAAEIGMPFVVLY